jgi:hypothetical protein
VVFQWLSYLLEIKTEGYVILTAVLNGCGNPPTKQGITEGEDVQNCAIENIFGVTQSNNY